MGPFPPDAFEYTFTLRDITGLDKLQFAKKQDLAAFKIHGISPGIRQDMSEFVNCVYARPVGLYYNRNRFFSPIASSHTTRHIDPYPAQPSSPD